MKELTDQQIARQDYVDNAKCTREQSPCALKTSGKSISTNAWLSVENFQHR